MSASFQITTFLGALALAWPFIGALLVAVVAVERKKESDSLSKIESLTAAIKVLKNN